MKHLKILLTLALVLNVYGADAASISIDPAQCETACDLSLSTSSTELTGSDPASSLTHRISLVLPESLSADTHEKVHVRFADLNFDGKRDILMAAIPASNHLQHHWLRDPSSGGFTYLGTTPPLTIDPLKKQLYAATKDPISQAFVTTFYQVAQGKITAIFTEKAEPTLQQGIYKKSRYQIENGHAKLLKVEFAYGASGH